MKKFRTLELAIEFNCKVEQIEIKGHMRDQLTRATTSIALNLAEGNSKPSIGEKKRFYQIAYSSLKEVQTALRLIKNQDDDLTKMADYLGASLYRLLNSNLTVAKPIQNSEYR